MVHAHGAEARLRHAGQWLVEQAGDAGLGVGAVVLAPSRGAANALLRALTSDRGGLLAIERWTLVQLAAELAVHDLAKDGVAPVSGLGTEALAARAVAQCLADDQLRYFTPVARLPGFARALTRTLSQLRGNQVTTESLLAGSDAARDLGQLLRAYETSLDRWSLIDAPGLLRRAHRSLRDRDTPDPRLGRPLLVLDVVPAYRSEQALLDALIRQAPRSLVTFPTPDAAARRAFEDVLVGDVVDLDSDDHARPTPNRLARLRTGIFAPESAVDLQDTDDSQDPDDPQTTARDNSLDFFGAPGESRECVEITRRIRGAADDGMPFDDVAILLRDPSSYLPLVEDALQRAEIPAYFTRGTARPHPAGRAFLALLACADERLSAARFAEYLSLGEVPALDEDGAPAEPESVPWVAAEGDQLVFASLFQPPPDPEPSATDPGAERDADSARGATANLDASHAGTLRAPKRWERLLVDAAVVGGRDRWARRLSGLEAEL